MYKLVNMAVLRLARATQTLFPKTRAPFHGASFVTVQKFIDLKVEKRSRADHKTIIVAPLLSVDMKPLTRFNIEWALPIRLNVRISPGRAVNYKLDRRWRVRLSVPNTSIRKQGQQ